MPEESIPAPQPVRRLPPERWAAEKKPQAWLLAGAFAHHRWEREFTLLTEAEFDHGLATVANLKIGG